MAGDKQVRVIALRTEEAEQPSPMQQGNLFVQTFAIENANSGGLKEFTDLCQTGESKRESQRLFDWGKFNYNFTFFFKLFLFEAVFEKFANSS